MSNICRLCLRNDDANKQNIFDDLLCDTLYWTFGVEVDPADEYSKLICQKCLNLVEYVRRLKNFFQMNQHFLHERKCPKEFDIENMHITIDVGTQTECEDKENRVKRVTNTLADRSNPFVAINKSDKLSSTVYRRSRYKRSKRQSEHQSQGSDPPKTTHSLVSPLRLESGKKEEPIDAKILTKSSGCASILPPTAKKDESSDLTDNSPPRLKVANEGKLQGAENRATLSNTVRKLSRRSEAANKDERKKKRKHTKPPHPTGLKVKNINKVQRRSTRKKTGRLSKYFSQYVFEKCPPRKPRKLSATSVVMPVIKDVWSVQPKRKLVKEKPFQTVIDQPVGSVFNCKQNVEKCQKKTQPAKNNTQDLQDNKSSEKPTESCNETRPVVELSRLEETAVDGYKKLDINLYKQILEENPEHAEDENLSNENIGGPTATINRSPSNTTPNQRIKCQERLENNQGLALKRKRLCDNGKQIDKISKKLVLDFTNNKEPIVEYVSVNTDVSMDSERLKCGEINHCLTTANGNCYKNTSQTQKVNDKDRKFRKIQNKAVYKKKPVLNGGGTNAEIDSSHLVSKVNNKESKTCEIQILPVPTSVSPELENMLPLKTQVKLEHESDEKPNSLSTIIVPVEPLAEIKQEPLAEIKQENVTLSTSSDLQNVCNDEDTEDNIEKCKSVHLPEILLFPEDEVDDNVAHDHDYCCVPVTSFAAQETKIQIQQLKKIQKVLCNIILSGNSSLQEHYNSVFANQVTVSETQ